MALRAEAERAAGADTQPEPEPEPEPTQTSNVVDIPFRPDEDAVDRWAQHTGVAAELWRSWRVQSVEEGGTLAIAFTWPTIPNVKKLRTQAQKASWREKPADVPMLWPDPIFYPPSNREKLYLTEGESDCGVLRSEGYDAYTFGGTNAIKGEELWETLEMWGLSPQQVVLIYDCDKAGLVAAKQLVKDAVNSTSWRTQQLIAIDLSSLALRTHGENDVRDLYARLGAELFGKLATLEAATFARAERGKPIAEVLATANADIDWVWNPYVAQGSVTLLCAEQKKGKTTFVFALIREMSNVAYNQTLLGRKVAQGNVLLFTEDSRSALKLRAKAHNVADLANLIVVSRDSPEYNMPPSWAELLHEIAGKKPPPEGPSLIIIDTLPVWADLEDENSPSVVAHALEPLRRLAVRNNVAIIVIHYLNKSGVYRGSGTFQAIPDILIDLITKEGATDQAGRQITVVEARSKLSPTSIEDVAFVLDEDSANVAILSTVDKNIQVTEKKNNQQRVYELIQQLPGITAKQIAKQLTLHDVYLGTLLRKLVAAGALRAEQDEKAGSAFGNVPKRYYPTFAETKTNSSE
jgi:hypothetical protein